MARIGLKLYIINMSSVIMFKIHTQKKGLIFHSKTSELVASEPHETQEKEIKKLHVMSLVKIDQKKKVINNFMNKYLKIFSKGPNVSTARLKRDHILETVGHINWLNF